MMKNLKRILALVMTVAMLAGLAVTANAQGEEGATCTHVPNIAAATCTAAQSCTVCTAELAPATGHAATTNVCTEDKYCACGQLLEAAREHIPGAAATCTAAQTCTDCGAELASALGHTPGAAATCTAAQSCTVCTAELAPALGHNPDPAAADCTLEQRCLTCGETVRAAKEHTPGAAATCTAAQTCTDCGAELAAALGHTPNIEAATCSEAQVCTLCSTELAAATGEHTYEYNRVNRVYSHRCTECGLDAGEAHIYDETHYCIMCGKRSSSSTHKYTVEGETHTCTVCGKVVEGHTWGQSHKCSLRGCSVVHEQPKHAYSYDHVCTICGFEYNGGKKEHQWTLYQTAAGGYVNYSVIQEVSCSQDGIYLHTCQVCGYEEQETITGGHAHKTMAQPTRNQYTSVWVGPHMIGGTQITTKYVGGSSVSFTLDRSGNRDKAILIAVVCNHCHEVVSLQQELSGAWGEYGTKGAPRKPGRVDGAWDYGYGSQLWTPVESWTFPAGYAGWDAVVGTVFTPANFDVTLPWLPYDVTFVDWDGTVLKQEKVYLGMENRSWIYNDATAPADPTREGYTFIGWDKPYTHVLSDLVITAQYEEADLPFTVRYMARTDNGSYGEVPANSLPEGTITSGRAPKGTVLNAENLGVPSRIGSYAYYYFTAIDGVTLSKTANVVTVYYTYTTPDTPATTTPDGPVMPIEETEESSQPGSEVVIEEEEVPLADAPATGDITPILLVVIAVSLSGMFLLRRKKDEA